jgi:hypothetical protein
MIRWGLILAAVIIAAGAWFDWTYHAIRTEIAELQARLPSEEDLNRDTGEQLKAAVRVANALATSSRTRSPDCSRAKRWRRSPSDAT